MPKYGLELRFQIRLDLVTLTLLNTVEDVPELFPLAQPRPHTLFSEGLIEASDQRSGEECFDYARLWHSIRRRIFSSTL